MVAAVSCQLARAARREAIKDRSSVRVQMVATMVASTRLPVRAGESGIDYAAFSADVAKPERHVPDMFEARCFVWEAPEGLPNRQLVCEIATMYAVCDTAVLSNGVHT